MEHQASLGRPGWLFWSRMRNVRIAVAENARGVESSARGGLTAALLPLTEPPASAGQRMMAGGDDIARPGGVELPAGVLQNTRALQNTRPALDRNSISVTPDELSGSGQSSAASIALPPNYSLARAPYPPLRKEKLVSGGSNSAVRKTFILNPNRAMSAPCALVNARELAAFAGIEQRLRHGRRYDFAQGMPLRHPGNGQQQVSITRLKHQ